MISPTNFKKLSLLLFNKIYSKYLLGLLFVLTYAKAQALVTTYGVANQIVYVSSTFVAGQPQPVYWNNDVEINPYTRVVINASEVRMASNIKVTVKIGAVLVIRGTIITHQNDFGVNTTSDSWNGIIVEGNAAQTQNEPYHDVVYDIVQNSWVMNSQLLGYARELTSDEALKINRSQFQSICNQGVLIIEKGGTEQVPKIPYISHMSMSGGVRIKGGGIIICKYDTKQSYTTPTQSISEKIKFIDNFGKCIYFDSYNKIQTSIISNTHFAFSGGLSAAPANFKQVTFLNINNNQKFYFIILFNYFYDPISCVTTGITLSNTDVDISQCDFNFLDNGIIVSFGGKVEINDNTFRGPKIIAIRGNNCYAGIFNNEFYSSKGSPIKSAIRLTSCSHDILHNKFSSSITQQNSDIGCNIEATGTYTGKIWDNFYENFDIGIQYSNANGKCTFLCNRLDNSLVSDVYVFGSNANLHGLPNQGSPSRSALNWFNNNPPNNFYDIDNSSNANRFTYYYNSSNLPKNREHPLLRQNINILTSTSTTDICNCHAGWVKAIMPPESRDEETIRHKIDSVANAIPSNIQTQDDSNNFSACILELSYLENQLVNCFISKNGLDSVPSHHWGDSIKTWLSGIGEPWALARLVTYLVNEANYADAASKIAILQSLSPSVDGQSEMCTALTFLKNYSQNNYDSSWFLQNYSPLLSIASGNSWACGLARGLIIDFASKDSGALAHQLYPMSMDTSVINSSAYSWPCNTALSIAPNPFGNSVQFGLTNSGNSSANIVFKIVDLNMSEKYAQNVTLPANTTTTISPSVSSLASGYYYAAIYCGGTVTSSALVYKQ